MTQPSDTTEPTRQQDLARLIDDIRAARLAGKEVDDATIRESHPHLLPELGAELEKLRRIENARKAASDPASPTITHDPELPPALLNDLEALPSFQIPGYSILRELSRGGQAVVYLATQLSTGRKIALKIMHNGPFASDRALTRFRREVQSLAALNHPNIVAIIDTGKTPDGSRFIAMNYIPGMNLSDYMTGRHKKDPTDPAKLLKLFLKICDAVNAAHRLGIIHRDLKPSNIRVDERGEPHILDFGLARTALDQALPNPDHAVSITGEFLGSLPWSSPEQAEGNPEKIDIRTDVYSLGVILYQILTAGRFPYEVVGNIRDVLHNILTADPTPPSKIAAALKPPKSKDNLPARTLPTINETIEKIVLKALAKKRELRYQSAGDLGRDVARYLAGQRTASLEQERPAKPKPASRKIPVAVILTIIVIVLFSSYALFARKNSPILSNPAPPQTQSASADHLTLPIEKPLPSTSPNNVTAQPSFTPATPRQPTPPSQTSSSGTLAILFKGGTLDLFLNGKHIYQSAGEDLRTIPLTLTPGDQITLRLNSSFYYRSVRCAFIADYRSHSFVEKAVATRIQSVSDPKSLPEPSFNAPSATLGTHDDRQQSLWSDAALPSPAEWIALPEANTTYDIAFTVPEVTK